MDPSGDNQPLSPGNPELSDRELGDPELSEQQVRQILDRTLALLQEQQAQRSGSNQLMAELLQQALERISSLMAGMRQSLASIEGLSEHERALAKLSFDGAEALISQAADSGTGTGSAHQSTSVKSKLQYGLNGLDLLQSGWLDVMSPGSIPRPYQPGLQPDQVLQRLAVESRLLRSLQAEQHQQPACREALHNLSMAAHRCRYLLKGCRQKLLPELVLVAMQLEDIAKGLKSDSGDSMRFWIGRIDQVEDRLAWLGMKQRRPWLPSLNVQKLVRRVRRLQQQDSVQGRMLAGLGVSLTISVVFLLATTTATTVLGALSAINSANKQAGLIDDYRGLTTEVKRLLDVNNQRRDIDASLESLQPSIEMAKQPLLKAADPREQGTSEGTRQSIQILENLNKERNLALGLKAEKDREFSLVITRLTLIYDAINRNESALALGATDEGSLANGAGQQNGANQQDAIGRQRGAWQHKGVEQNWYGPIIDTLAGPLQDPELLKHSRRIAIAAFAGALGSIMSILIRLDQVDEKNVKNPFVVGALKPVIGAVFGVVIFMVLTTNVIDFMPANFRLHDQTAGSLSASGADVGNLSAGQDPLGDLDSQELYKIFLVAFIAGFSERLAGDTLRSVDRK